MNARLAQHEFICDGKDGVSSGAAVYWMLDKVRGAQELQRLNAPSGGAAMRQRAIRLYFRDRPRDTVPSGMAE